MANIKSQIKRNRQNEKRRERNRMVKSSVRTAAKKLVKAIDANEKPEAVQKLYVSFVKTIDKAANVGVIHWKNSARKKSRLAKRINKTIGAAS